MVAARGRQLTGTGVALSVEPLDPAADPALADRLVGLQRRSYAVESELIGDDRIPPLRETAAELRAAGLQWLGVVAGDGALIGAVAFEEDARVVDIHRLVVDPTHLRQGAGRTLVTVIQTRAADRLVTVSTGRDNPPARALYERLGFRRVQDVEVVPGLWVTRYEWSAPLAG